MQLWEKINVDPQKKVPTARFFTRGEILDNLLKLFAFKKRTSILNVIMEDFVEQQLVCNNADYYSCNNGAKMFGSFRLFYSGTAVIKRKVCRYKIPQICQFIDISRRAFVVFRCIETIKSDTRSRCIVQIDFLCQAVIPKFDSIQFKID